MGAIDADGVVAKLLRRLELRLCEHSVKIVTTMPYAHQYLSSQGVSPEKVVWISNGVDVREFDRPARLSGDQERFVFLYFGAFGTANAIDSLIRAYASIADDTTCFRLVGDGPMRSSIELLIRDLGLTNRVHLEPPVKRDRIPELAEGADALVVGLLPLALYRYGMSLNKLYEYMAAGRPIVFAGSARGNPLELSGGGIISDGTVQGTAKAMSEMVATSRLERESWGTDNRRYVEQHFDYRGLAVRLARVLDQAAVVAPLEVQAPTVGD